MDELAYSLSRKSVRKDMCTYIMLRIHLLPHSPQMKENKKVLLRERKRHNARRVASARYAALSNGGGGVPHPVLGGG